MKPHLTAVFGTPTRQPQTPFPLHTGAWTFGVDPKPQTLNQKLAFTLGPQFNKHRARTPSEAHLRALLRGVRGHLRWPAAVAQAVSLLYRGLLVRPSPLAPRPEIR